MWDTYIPETATKSEISSRYFVRLDLKGYTNISLHFCVFSSARPVSLHFNICTYLFNLPRGKGNNQNKSRDLRCTHAIRLIIGLGSRCLKGINWHNIYVISTVSPAFLLKGGVQKFSSRFMDIRLDERNSKDRFIRGLSLFFAIWRSLVAPNRLKAYVFI